MKATELLRQQHDETRALFTQIAKSTDPDEKAALFEELADSLAAHGTIEEKIFYPAVYGPETEDLLHESVQEHLEVKRMLAVLLDGDSTGADFDAKVKALEQLVEHHVKEEEEQLFPKVERDLGKATLEKIAVSMEELFDQEMLGEPREEVRDQLDQPAPLP